jgi:hypothetical protein
MLRHLLPGSGIDVLIVWFLKYSKTLGWKRVLN